MSPASTARPLALLGGTPSFERQLHVGAPNLPPREAVLSRIEAAYDRRRLTNEGPHALEFAARVADLAGVPHCLAVCNATTGLQLACRALGLSGEVIVPSFTFVATAHALTWLGLTPVFCDIRADTHQLDPVRVEELIGPRTSAILGVHLWGRASAAPALEALGAEHGLAVLFDAAHGVGCAHRGRPVGSFGDAEVFSFHATKLVSTLEGGGVVTRDPVLAEELRVMHNFGFTGYDEVSALGINAKMDEFSAGFGLASLDQLDTVVAANKAAYARYQEALAGGEGLRMVLYAPEDHNNHQYAIVEVGPEAALSRDELHAVLWAEGALARRYFYPGCHAGEPYRSHDPDVGERLPVTQAVAAGVLALPTGTAVTLDEIDRVAEIVRTAITRPDDVRRALENR